MQHYNRAGAIPSSVARGRPNRRRTGDGGAPLQISRNLEYIFLKDIRKKACLLPPSFAVMHSAGFHAKFLDFLHIFASLLLLIPKSCQFKLDTELAFMSDVKRKL